MKEGNRTIPLLLLVFPRPEYTLLKFPGKVFDALRRESKMLLKVHYLWPLFSGVNPQFYGTLRSAPLYTQRSSEVPPFLFVAHFECKLGKRPTAGGPKRRLLLRGNT